MDNKYNVIEFCTTDYEERDRFYETRINEKKLFEDIAEFIRIATKNGYQCRVWFDGTTYAVEYNFLDREKSDVTLEWVGEDEYVEKCGKAESDDISWKRIEEVAQDVMDDCGICY